MAGLFDPLNQFLPPEAIAALNEAAENVANNVVVARTVASNAERDALPPTEGMVVIVNNKQQHYSNGQWRNADGSLT